MVVESFSQFSVGGRLIGAIPNSVLGYRQLSYLAVVVYLNYDFSGAPLHHWICCDEELGFLVYGKLDSFTCLRSDFFFLILWSTKDDVTNIYVHTTLNVNILTFFFTSCVCLIFKRQLQVTFLLFLSSPLPVPSPEITTCMHLVFIPPVLVLILLLHIRVSKSKMQCCLKFIQTL